MDGTRLLLSRIDDLVYKSYMGEFAGFGFLNEMEVSLAHSYLSNLNVEHRFYGGYENATRMYLYLTSDFALCNDISAILISVKGEFNLSHRDFLGSLMGLGISRDCVGDILVVSTGAVAFVRSDIAEYIKLNLSSVGRFSVVVSDFVGDTAKLCADFAEIEIIISSMRIDNLVTSICKCSRQQAVDYISDDKVFVNYLCIDKASKNICTGDTVSIRGFGKFKIGEVLRHTKSGRYVLSITKYI